MKWTRLAAIADAPQEGLRYGEAKASLVGRTSEFIWLITRDDDTPVLVAGLFRASFLLPQRMIWFIPYAALRPSDWRGMLRLWDLLRAKLTHVTALVDTDNAAARRVVLHAGFRFLQQYDDSRDLFEWRTQFQPQH